MKNEVQDNAPFIIEGTLTNLHYECGRANLLAQVETHYKRNAVVTGVGAVVGELFGQATNAAMLAMYDGEETQNFVCLVDDKAEQKSHITAASAYYVSMGAFAGTVPISLLGAAGAVADVAVKRGVGGAVAERISARFGARGALFSAEVIGLEISATISGVGIVLLGVGIMGQLFALLTTPGELQDWMSRSYFGQLPDKTQPPNKFAKGDWKSENEALMAALKKEKVA